MKTKSSTKFLALLLGLFALPAGAASDSLYEFSPKSLMGEKVPLSQYKGKVIAIVNTASHCGYTPQYEALQAIYHQYQAQGFEVLAFPSNDFNGQEPGSAKEIKNFCETKYKVTFPLFEKNPVSGKDIQPLFDWLIHHDPDPSTRGKEVAWNFEKFIVGRDGKLVARFLSSVKPDDAVVKTAIEKALAQPVSETKEADEKKTEEKKIRTQSNKIKTRTIKTSN